MVCNTAVFIFFISCSAAMDWDSESVKSDDIFKQPGIPDRGIKAQPSTPQSNGGVRLHEFVSKTVSFFFTFTETYWHHQPYLCSAFT